MTLHTFLLETLRIEPAQLARFTENYHHQHLPQLLHEQASLRSIKRYEEFGVASSLAWFSQRHLTFYDFNDGIASGVVSDIAHEGIHHQSRHVYEEIYRHPRNQDREPFGRRPFFVVTVELDDAKKVEFCQWYHIKYLPKTLADVPMWSACRRYRSVDRQREKQITVYEAEDEADLNRGFELLRADYRYSSNADWNRWVGNAIQRQDAASFRPVFCLPD